MTRYFYASTVGQNNSGDYTFSGFTFKHENDFPTYSQIIRISKEKFPYLYHTLIISISELSEKDYNSFISSHN
jgi:hypothetical protein